MKLIIDIQDDTYKTIKEMMYFYSPRGSGRKETYEIANAIKNSIPLEDIKADIASKIIDYRYNSEVEIDDVLAILDGENKE